MEFTRGECTCFQSSLGYARPWNHARTVYNNHALPPSESSVDFVILSNHFYRVRRLRLLKLNTLQDGDEFRRKGTFPAQPST